MSDGGGGGGSNGQDDWSHLPYRPCVGIMVLNHQGKVWIGQRISEGNTEYSGSPKRWQMPQGGIDKGEDPKPASLRELVEETGIKSVTLLDQTEDWLTYDLPKHLLGTGLKGKYRGQKQMWFAYRFDGDESEIAINPPPGGHDAEFDDWRWEDMAKLPELIVEFKQDIYTQLVKRFAHLAK
ncbi:MAG: RNA pyrophosphohydrolase [Rhizobiaceae bacterium]|nr:RNA pyrophosphohydrolase [Hyphomicrobiales bacterium]NRB29490.1 RNA pyrophosphohydrolase [Rhizobiaceae bacterium]